MSAPAVEPAPPAAGTYFVPSLGWRILGGTLRLVPLVVLLVGIPVAILTYLQSRGISLPVPILTVELSGIAITILVVARYIAKPTGAFGPLAIATAGVTVVYLYSFLVDATYHLTIPSMDIGIGIEYRNPILLLMIVPALTLGAGVLTTIEDAVAPKERLPFDFPA
ncbi:MAG: hypothetical protein ACRECT_00985 [Thermoplasmata archaeon]